MYGTIRKDDERTVGYYVLQWTSEPYILQEDKEIEGYTPPITFYAGEIVCDDIFLNLVHFSKYWYTLMKIGVGDVTVRLKQVLLPNITMMKIDKTHPLPKRCKKKGSYKIGSSKNE